MVPDTTVGGQIASAVTESLSIVTTNMPLIFGVAVAFVVWKVGKRILGKV